MKKNPWYLSGVFLGLAGIICGIFSQEIKNILFWISQQLGKFLLGWLNGTYVTATHDPKGSAINSATFIFCSIFMLFIVVYTQSVYDKMEMIAEEKEKVKINPQYIPTYNMIAFRANRIKEDINLRKIKIANPIFITACFFCIVFILTTIITPITIADNFHRRMEVLSTVINNQERDQLRIDWVLINDKSSYDRLIEFTNQLSTKYKIALPNN